MAISPVDIAYYAALGEGTSTEVGPNKGFLLSEGEYLQSRGTLQQAAEDAAKARQAAGATTRGALGRQSNFLVAAGLGGGLTQERAARELDPVLQAYGTRSSGAEREAFEATVDRALEEQRRKREEVAAGLATGASLEGTVGTAVLSSNPFTAAYAPLHSGISAGKGILYTGTVSGTPAVRREQQQEAGTYVDPNEYIDRYLSGVTGTGAGGDVSSEYRGRGGGGRDVTLAYQGLDAYGNVIG